MSEIRKVLIANRGVCSCRIMETCTKMNIAFVTIFTKDDEESLHVRDSKESYRVASYMDLDGIIEIAKNCNTDAIHPGYGFQSENPLFAEKCSDAGLIFIGPTADNIRTFNQKHVAKQLAKNVDIPTLPDSGLLRNVDDAIQSAAAIGYPVVLKLTAGGGGIGMHICNDESQLRKRFDTSRMQGEKFFGCGDMYVEKYLQDLRHVEVQVFGDGKGSVVHFGERECSVQRRHQKIIEEAPCSALTVELRQQLCEMAIRLCKSVNYRSAGTVEFLVDNENKQVFFLEVNVRLQVEHRVTELIYGIDLVQWMINFACPSHKGSLEKVSPRGHAIECRICAEDPMKDFQPSSGILTEVVLPEKCPNSNLITDHWVYRGCKISSKYDSLVVNLVQWGLTRSVAIRKLAKSLKNTVLRGPITNIDFLTTFIENQEFFLAKTHTNILNTFNFYPRCVEVLSPGLFTTVQDWPGRIGRGLWRVGVPPSGPMDHLSCRVANCLVGNPESSAVLEITASGPKLKFHCDTYVSLTGASMDVAINGEAISMWKATPIKHGDILDIGSLNTKSGFRAYLAIAGGIEVEEYLGSRSTFASGSFGGYQGRPINSSAILKIGTPINHPLLEQAHQAENVDAVQAEYGQTWEIGVLPGPHASPDFFTEEDMEMFYRTEWKVHHSSNRLGIRLIGPAPQWARTSGGEGGSHPSNIHDCVYAVGTVNFTGNMPIIIAQDGPSLGGFVCPCTIVQSELWKIGQVRAGNLIKFRQLTYQEAIENRAAQADLIKVLSSAKPQPRRLPLPDRYPSTKVILHKIPSCKEYPGMVIRLAGDSYILIEYGDMVLDLNLRFRVHFLEQWILQHDIPGLEETAPGVRSLQIRYDPIILLLEDLIQIVIIADDETRDISHLSISTRVIHLPMCFNYSGVDQAITRYMKSVRGSAPYLPSNIEYTARNNGLAGIEDVKEKVFSASYMCLGLGDVYLGACCAVPLNPLHRLVTSKYNPARTYTQEGTVGLGGSYMCIYPMASPGGYQLIGRTLPIWDTFAVSNSKLFSRDKPWLLRMFDQIRFYEVSETQLDQLRAEFARNRLHINIKNEVFDIAKYNAFLKSIEDEIKIYRKIQEAASHVMLKEEEKSLSELKNRSQERETDRNGCEEGQPRVSPAECNEIRAAVTGSVSEMNATVGQSVLQDQILVTIEAMKMECSCNSPVTGFVVEVLVDVGQLVQQGELLVLVKPQNTQ